MSEYEELVANARAVAEMIRNEHQQFAISILLEELAHAVEELDTQLTTWIEGETGI